MLLFSSAYDCKKQTGGGGGKLCLSGPLFFDEDDAFFFTVSTLQVHVILKSTISSECYNPALIITFKRSF